MAKIGYARVSTLDQNLDHQIDALTKAGCDRVFSDQGVSGKLASRPQFDAALDYLREGDTFVVTRLTRLGRSTKNLLEVSESLAERKINLVVLEQGIDTSTATGKLVFTVLAAIAQFQRELTVEATVAGLEAARARGKVGGRRAKLTADQVATAREIYEAKTRTVQQIADLFGVSRATIYRALEVAA